MKGNLKNVANRINRSNGKTAINYWPQEIVVKQKFILDTIWQGHLELRNKKPQYPSGMLNNSSNFRIHETYFDEFLLYVQSLPFNKKICGQCVLNNKFLDHVNKDGISSSSKHTPDWIW